MKQRFIAIILFIFTFGFGSSHAFAIYKFKSCEEFDTWKEAQDFFEENGGNPNYNFEQLDADGDGIVCEDKEDYQNQTWEDLHPIHTDEDNGEGNDQGIDEGGDGGNGQGIDEDNGGGEW